MSEIRRRPSMADVAREAGVSYQTVSRVLNDPQKVRSETAERVRASIAHLGFTPNRAARALRTARSSLIGVLAPSSPLLGPMSMLYAIEEAAREMGYATILSAVKDDAQAAAQVISLMIEQGVEGIIVIAPFDGIVASVSRTASDVPMIGVGALMPESTFSRTVGIDQRRGAREAVQHLLGSGCRNVLHLHGPADWFDARERARGAVEACAGAGVELEVTNPLAWSAAAGYAEMSARAASGMKLPDAIFAASDSLALGAMRALRDAGVQLPDDVVIIGFDDLEIGSFTTPALSTVRQPFAEVGRVAVRVLLEGGEGVEDQLLLAPVLVLRESA